MKPGLKDFLFNCHEVTHQLSQGMDAPLPWRRRAALRLHLMICVSCRRMRRQMQWLRAIIQELGDNFSEEACQEITLPPERRERIRAKLK